MREDLINKLLEEFEKDKVVIKYNLLKTMDTIILETSNDYENARLTIKITRKGSENNEYMGKNEKKKGNN